MKKVLLSIALLAGVSVWANNAWNYNVYDDCSKNGYYIGIENGYVWVDLGLPSGIKWASCNVGAEKPEDYGNYYAWGEVLPKEDYSWTTYKYANGNYNKLTKYCNNASYGDNGFTDNKTTLDPEDDAAHVNWGGSWRMPTNTEWQELQDNCTWTWTTQNGINGYRVTSQTNSNSIFLPAAGFRDGTSLGSVGKDGSYWSSSLYEFGPDAAWFLVFYSGYVGGDYSSRSSVQSVRPVCLSTSTQLSAEDNFTTLTLYSDGCESANMIRCDRGQQINVSAIPDKHRHFVRWSDGNTGNPRLVTVTKDTTFIAEFADDPILTLVSSDDSRGYVYGGGQFKSNTPIEISAYPRFGYHFTQWSDGNTDNPREIVLTCDTTFTAEFAQTFSGQCWENLYWKYEGHTLTISGTGNMYDYNENDMPWLLFRDTTDVVILERGITGIGNNAFNGFVKLGKIELPNTLTSIGANAFAGCRKLYDIYSYAVEPPVAEKSSFANYNVYLHVPCDNLRDYQMDAVFGSFKYIQCIGAENTTTDGTVTVTPSDNEAVFVWRADESAASYNLEIRKDGEVFCTLIFNANGQLTSIAFAPARNGQTHRAAEQTGAGFRFTVTGLSESTRYTFGMTVKDATNATLQTYTGEFNTTGVATSLDNATTDTVAQKIIRNGQVLILRGDKTYSTMGVEVNL